jgi:hypothetical protein
MLPSSPPLSNNARDSLVATIIRAALRDAATAPTVFDALDVTGEALRQLSKMTPIQSGSDA